MTPSEPAISLFSGTLGAFLISHRESSGIIPSEAILAKVNLAINWLQENNPLIQRYGFGIRPVQDRGTVFPHATLSLPQVTQEWDPIEPPLPSGHYDVVVDPGDFHTDIHNEDHRYFRLPAGVAFTARDGQRGPGVNNYNANNLPFVVPHSDPDLEALLFTSLYVMTGLRGPVANGSKIYGDNRVAN